MQVPRFYRLLLSSIAIMFSAILLVNPATLDADDWTQFRGPQGNGTTIETGLPLEWDAKTNVVWKTEMPGFGAGSPVTWKDRIYATCYSGYGLDAKEPGEQENLKLHLVCFDRETGAIRWNSSFKANTPDQPYQSFISLHGYTSGTPTVDETGIYIFCGRTGARKFSHDGEEQWSVELGDKTHAFGTANSPVLFQDTVIVNASIESGSLVALRKKDGSEVWRQGDIKASWNTPCLVTAETDDGPSHEVVVNTLSKLRAFDAASGEPLWTCDAFQDYICPTAIANEGIVYAIGARKGGAVAVRAGGRGDVTETHRLWILSKGSNVSSPVLHEGHLYWASEDKGILYCADAVAGELVYQERLEPASDLIYASPLLSEGRLYYMSRQKGAFVVAAQPEFKLLAHNVIEDDQSVFNASIVPNAGRLLLKSDRFLYCIGK